MALNHDAINRVRRLKVSDTVAVQLERLIIEGSYLPGDKLPAERELAERFAVGRSTMREALRIVESSGLVRVEHGIGVFVISNVKHRHSTDLLMVDESITVSELFEVRRPIEREAAGLASSRINPVELTQLHRIIAEASDLGISDAEFIKLDHLLHRSVAIATKNALLVRLIDSIAPLFLQYSEKVISLPGRREAAHSGHIAIVDAIAKRQPVEARRAALRHINAVEKDIVNQLETGNARHDANSSRS